MGGDDMSERPKKVAKWEAEALEPDDSEACSFEQAPEIVLLVPAVVTDVDIRRPEATPSGGDRKEEHSGGLKQPAPLAQRGLVVLNVFEDLKCADEIEGKLRIELGEVAKKPLTLIERRQPPLSGLACPQIGLDPGVVVDRGQADGESTLTRADLEH